MSTNQDSHIARIASNEAKNAQDLPEVEDAETGYEAIRVRNETPELGRAQVVVLGANNPYQLLVPRDPNRRSAYVMAIDNDVYICSSREVAAQVAGGATATIAFYLPKQIVVPIDSKSAFFAAATTTGSNTRISVLVNKDNE